jgi:glucose-6-phosphate 1-epimerase
MMPNLPNLRDPRTLCAKVKGVTLVERDGGTVVDIATPAVRAAVALQGAHLLSWTPRGHTDLLWLSPLSKLGGGKAIRGGIPICWPWFGPHASDPSQQQHGFARNLDWSLFDVSRYKDDVSLGLTLPLAAVTSAGFPHPVSVSLRVNLGADLSLDLTTHNLGSEPLVLTTALHTYFRVADASRARVDGLDGVTYRDNADAGRTKRQFGTLHLECETIAMFDTAPATQTLTDPVLRRSISIKRHGAKSTVVWNPGANAVSMADIPNGGAAEFVCVESGAIGLAAVTLQPDASHTLLASYAVSSF